MNIPKRFGPAWIIGLASLINVLAGVVLKEAGAAPTVVVQLGGLALAGLLGLGQFFLWRKAHERYPLSVTYPFTGLTFPMALVVAALYKEQVGVTHVVATLLVTVGVIIVHRSQDTVGNPT
ncbi:MAG: hypothetical protein OEY55_08810 [Acidimicrobiia bacterium]|nr:hypothetical protein [Acidimicrobiia bacterium]MDH5421890.1 hypothetical protein [Acidimicrobiia bacterium]MDH5503675.1 hypothetical protein [Acidimicrobiia bacterium]